MAKFYDYKEQKSYKDVVFTCKKCGWSGTGAQSKEGMDSSSGFPVLCPTCEECIEWIDILVSTDELLKYGNEQDKEDALKTQRFYARVESSRKGFHDSLPEIDSDAIVITLREEERETDGDDGYIVLYWNEQEIWREVRTFEYYDRYLELGKVLKEKHGDRLLDFETEYTVYLGGDKLTAFDEVERFRKTLGRWKPILGWCVWVTKTGDRPYGLVRWHMPKSNTEWIDALVLQGKATPISDGRCPRTYHIKAEDILPIVGDDESLEAHIGQIGYGEVPRLRCMRNDVYRENALYKCLPDEILCMEMWDLAEIG